VFSSLGGNAFFHIVARGFSLAALGPDLMSCLRHKKAIVLIVGFSVAASAAAQRGLFARGLPPNPPYDGAFMFCRIMFRQNPYGDGNGWSVDYPRADLNLPYRLSELSSMIVSKDVNGHPNHVLLRLTDPEIYQCPFIMMTEPGGAYFDDAEAAALGDYLLKGGFLWADDFWGEVAWSTWEREIRKALPASEYPIVDLPLAHPLFHMLYQVTSVPQIPAIDFWFGTGGQTSERGAASAVAHARAISDAHGNVMVLMTHNTDFGDAFEREGDSRAYFDRFAGVGYAFGINALLYAMTH
jgi:Domain of unknown function (DUF4159)